jgi:putative flippase GtrA
MIFSYSMLRKMANLEPGEMAFSKRFITEKLVRAGFKNIQIDYKDFLLPGIPDFLITPSIWVGAVLEKLPVVSKVSQSIFIRARKLSGTVVPQESLPTHRTQLLFLARYGISGIAGGAITVLFLFVWVTLLGLEKTYLLGLGLGFIVALIVTFALQKYWAFRDREPGRTGHQLVSYSVVAITGLVLNAVLLAGAKLLFEWLALDFFHGWYLVVQTGIVCVVAVFNFGMNFLFTFRHARQERLWDR